MQSTTQTEIFIVTGRMNSGKSTLSSIVCGERSFTEINAGLGEYIDSVLHINNINAGLLPDLHKNRRLWVISHIPNAAALQFSIADSLKLLCSAVFNIPANVLMAENAEDKKVRDSMKIYLQDIEECGIKDIIAKKVPREYITCREMLEIVGTDIMRHLCGEDVWINSTIAAIKQINPPKAVISDLRFINEYTALAAAFDHTHLFFICKSLRELYITAKDRSEHISRWEFLNLLPYAELVIINRGISVDDLAKISTKAFGGDYL